MRFQRLTSSSDSMFLTAMDLYWSSFPLPRQREYQSQCSIMDEEDYRFELIYEDEEFIGIALCWETDRFIYVEHLCICHEKRRQGLGSRALELLRREGKTLVLEADPPKGETGQRRVEFYEKLGFAPNDREHIHPSYHVMFPGNAYLLMSCPNELSEGEYKEFISFLVDRVMAM